MNILLTLKRILLIIRQNSRIVIKLVIIDQLVKWWFINYLRGKIGLTMKVTSFLDIVYSWNHGISFGMFRNYYQYSNMLFIVINSVVIIYLWYILLKCKTMTGFVGYSFVIGGAIGNLIDRFVNGAVFDFIYFHYQDFGFPIFNLADSFISLGVIFLIHDYYKTKKIVEQQQDIKYNHTMIQAEADRIRELDFKKNINLRGD
jgi:signal peptidase II